MNLGADRRFGAFSLPEMMVTLGCGTMILAALIVCSVALQKSFASSSRYSTSKSDQLRVQDYIMMDCRRTTGGSVTQADGTTLSTPVVDNGSWVNGGGTGVWSHDDSGPSTLILTLPEYYDSSGNPIGPSFDGYGRIRYKQCTDADGNDVGCTKTVSYYKSGSRFMRQIGTNSTECLPGAPWSDCSKAIATDVVSFNVSPLVQPSIERTVSCSVMFFPTFRYNTGVGTWRAGSDAPSSSLGSDGDYYVIDVTASSSSAVGDVYYKKNGIYSLVQNIKATTIFSQVFLRNAQAQP